MNSIATTLSGNIRYFRKKLKISQEELAEKMGIKRSNIAAYESKNVEPRLRIILKMSKYFDISVKDLVEKKISDDVSYEKQSKSKSQGSPEKGSQFHTQDSPEIRAFIDKSMKIKQILDGFKAFYVLKRKSLPPEDHAKQKLMYDIDNFIELMDHLMTYNEKVISALSKANHH